MRLTRENYEEVLFDLLEGNLSDEVAAEVRSEIAKDSFYQDEWDLISSAVLEPEEVLFGNKKALLKTSTTSILNKSNYELILFDLLEGNLPVHRARIIEQELEMDPFYSKEYRYMQATVLNHGEIQAYPRKESLLKKEPRMVPMWTWASAIAACFIAALFWLSPSGTQVIPETIVEKEDPIVVPAQDINAEKVEIVEEGEKKGTKDVFDGALKQNLLFSPRLKKRPVTESVAQVQNEETDKETESSINVLNNKKIFNEDQEEMVVRDESKPNTDVLETPESLNKIELEDISDQDESLYVNDIEDVTKNNIGLVTYGLRDRIKGKMINTLVSIGNPKLRVKRSNSEDYGFDVVLQTNRYEATASINPFKNKIKEQEKS